MDGLPWNVARRIDNDIKYGVPSREEFVDFIDYESRRTLSGTIYYDYDLVDAIIRAQIIDEMRKVLESFSKKYPRNVKILIMYEVQEFTLEEIARHFEVTRERIRQILSRTKRMLRHPSIGKRLFYLWIDSGCSDFVG